MDPGLGHQPGDPAQAVWLRSGGGRLGRAAVAFFGTGYVALVEDKLDSVAAELK